jgi:hypothetical protein
VLVLVITRELTRADLSALLGVARGKKK